MMYVRVQKRVGNAQVQEHVKSDYIVVRVLVSSQNLNMNIVMTMNDVR